MIATQRKPLKQDQLTRMALLCLARQDFPDLSQRRRLFKRREDRAVTSSDWTTTAVSEGFAVVYQVNCHAVD
jgi:hypothetical protein